MSTFNAKRITRSYTQRIMATPDKVFPLLCPVREKDWADGWEYNLVYSDSGVAEPDCVFTTPHGDMPETIWIVTRHEPENLYVEFLNVTPGVRVVKAQIQLEDNRDGTTAAQITYSYTGLSDRGNALIDRITDDHFKHEMIAWEHAMNHYLRTGTTLKTHAPH